MKPYTRKTNSLGWVLVYSVIWLNWYAALANPNINTNPNPNSR